MSEISGLSLLVFLAIYTVIVILFGVIGFAIKKDIRFVVILQILVGCIMAAFIELFLSAVKVLV